MSTDVVNLRAFRRRSGPFLINDLPDDVVRVDRPTAWGNPIRIGATTSRAEAIRQFRLYAIDRLVREPAWLDPLGGKRLACHCAPLACHGDVLVELRGLVAAARRVMRPAAMASWLDTPAPVFSGLAPRDVIAADRTREVVAALHALAEGTFV